MSSISIYITDIERALFKITRSIVYIGGITLIYKITLFFFTKFDLTFEQIHALTYGPGCFLAIASLPVLMAVC